MKKHKRKRKTKPIKCESQKAHLLISGHGDNACVDLLSSNFQYRKINLDSYEA